MVLVIMTAVKVVVRVVAIGGGNDDCINGGSRDNITAGSSSRKSSGGSGDGFRVGSSGHDPDSVSSESIASAIIMMALVIV